jgi:hypothetical protein
MTRRLTSVSGRVLVAALVGVVLLGGATLVVARHDATAQFGPGQPGQPGFMPPMPMGPPGGQGIAMLVHKNLIFIAQGGTLYKIDPDEMKVLGEVQYQKPPPPPDVFGPPPR